MTIHSPQWPDQSIAFLRQEWGRMTPNAIAIALGGKTAKAVVSKAYSLGLSTRGPAKTPRKCLCGCNEEFLHELPPAQKRINPDHEARLR